MAIKKYDPTTPGRRGMTVTDYSVLNKVAPERSLLEPMKKHSGRNNTGRITVRHQGGGNRVVTASSTSSATRPTCPPRLPRSSTIRTVPLASLWCSTLTVKRYIMAPEGLKVGRPSAGSDADIKPGNACPSRTSPSVPSSTTSSCQPGKGAQLSPVPPATWPADG